MVNNICPIIRELQNENEFDVRVTHNDKWLVWDDYSKEWVVCHQVNSSNTKVVYRGLVLELAIEHLMDRVGGVN